MFLDFACVYDSQIFPHPQLFLDVYSLEQFKTPNGKAIPQSLPPTFSIYKNYVHP